MDSASSMSDPFMKIKESIDAAHEANDRNADLLFLSTANENGQPSVRTLILRKIDEGRLLVLFSRHHDKWEDLQSNQKYEVLLWYPSIGHQYRIRGDYRLADTDVLSSLWQEQPTAIRRVDLGYGGNFVPGSECNDLCHFQSHIRSLPDEDVQSAPPPKHVVAAWLIGTHVERLVAAQDRLHDRIQYTIRDGQWQEQRVVP